MCHSSVQTVLDSAMMMYSLYVLCVFSLVAVLQVPGTTAWFTIITRPRGGGGGGGGRGGGGPRGVQGMTQAERDEIVNKHNALRRHVHPSASNMLEMSWNDEAEANARRWADSCSMEHSSKSARVISTSGCGENLYMASWKNSWSNAIQSWYDEVNDFRYGVGSTNGGVVGHYTQVVWYRSNHVGCAMAHCPNSEYKYFYVCQYCPPGNSQLARPYKAGRTCGDCPHDCNNRLCTNPCDYSNKYSNCPELKEEWGCSNSDVSSWCPASCRCTDQIV